MGRFELCLEEHGKPIGHLLYKLKPKENVDIDTLLNINVPDNTEPIICTPVLEIPLDMPPSKDLIRLIAEKLLYSEYLPYILRQRWPILYPPDYQDKIKHVMDMSTIFIYIDNNEYETMEQFQSDVMLMWDNVRCFLGNDSYPAKQADKLELDLSYVWERHENMLDLLI